MNKITIIFESASHTFGKLVSPFTDVLSKTTLKLIQPRHGCPDRINTLQTAILATPQINCSTEVAPFNRYALHDR
jgi:hypothetical protein